MKRIISLLIALLIGALASWNTPKAHVTPQNAGFEAITAEVEEQTAEEESPAEALVEGTVTEEEQDEPTAVLIEPEETEAFAPEPTAETEPTKLMVVDDTATPEEPTKSEPGEGREPSPITEPEQGPGEITDTAPTIEEESYEPTVAEEVTVIQEQTEVAEEPSTQATEPIYNPSLGKRPYEEPVDEHGIGVNADDLVGPDGLRCGEGIHF